MKVLLVDDHVLVRKGLISILSNIEQIHEIIEASSIDNALKQLSKHNPDIAIVDLRLGNEDGVNLVNKAHSKGFVTKFIILTSSNKISDFSRAKEADIYGYILKEAFAEDILYAIKVVMRGKKFYDQELLTRESSHYDEFYLEELTPREKDVLIEIGKGLSNSEIANILYISEHTVKKHVSSILSKLNLTHRTQAAIFVNETLSAI